MRSSTLFILNDAVIFLLEAFRGENDKREWRWDKEWQTRSSVIRHVLIGSAKVTGNSEWFELRTIAVTSIKRWKKRSAAGVNCALGFFLLAQSTELCNPFRLKAPKQHAIWRNRFLYFRLRGGSHAGLHAGLLIDLVLHCKWVIHISVGSRSKGGCTGLIQLLQELISIAQRVIWQHPT